MLTSLVSCEAQLQQKLHISAWWRRLEVWLWLNKPHRSYALIGISHVFLLSHCTGLYDEPGAVLFWSFVFIDHVQRQIFSFIQRTEHLLCKCLSQRRPGFTFVLFSRDNHHIVELNTLLCRRVIIYHKLQTPVPHVSLLVFQAPVSSSLSSVWRPTALWLSINSPCWSTTVNITSMQTSSSSLTLLSNSR